MCVPPDDRTVTSMRTMGIKLAVVLVATGALAGCAFSFDENRTFSDDRTDNATVHDVRITGGDGAVTLRRTAGFAVQIHREVSYHGSKPAGRQDRIDEGTLLLDTSCGRGCVISYRVLVPERVNVVGQLDAGPIDLTDVDTVTVGTQDGSIAIQDAAGDVTVRTDTGQIDLESITGTVAALSQDGSITATTLDKSVTAVTDTGPISLTDVTGTVSARTKDGAITIDRVNGSVTAQTDTGPISGEGLAGTRTRAETSDGSITLRLTAAQDVDAHTVTGPIELTVPPTDGGYRVQTKTNTGSTAVNIATNPSGTHSLVVNSEDGAITINSV
jgi:hypothetical protein